MRANSPRLFFRTFNPLSRKVYAWNAYPTPAINTNYYLKPNASALHSVKTYQKNIFYLAQWRTHLFFLLLIAYYRTKNHIAPAPTILQYGFGYGERIHAAHPSLFPQLSDKHLKHYRINTKHRSIIDNTFLSHWNNMTVPCPVISNQFDSFIEGNGRDSLYKTHLLFILNSCARGISNPVVSMRYFFTTMQPLVFKNKNVFIKKFKNKKNHDAAKMVIQIQKKGMFYYARRDLSLKNKYISRILQWDKKNETLETALKRTQKILLKGNKNEAIAFLKRYESSSQMRRDRQDHMRDSRITSRCTRTEKKAAPTPR